jgi:hypothetical protein
MAVVMMMMPSPIAVPVHKCMCRWEQRPVTVV